MPVIFDDETRKNLRNSLLESGFQLIKMHGYKKTSVEQIAKSCGIAKGTFYNFFENKESFVYEILIYKRNIAKEYFQTLINNKQKLSSEDFRKFIEFLTFGDNNLMLYLTDADMNLLSLKWPVDALFNKNNDEKTCLWILGQLDNLNPNVDWKIFANYCKAITIIQHNKKILYNEVLKETFDRLIDDLINYLFYN